jgi:hypothetical protein
MSRVCWRREQCPYQRRQFGWRWCNTTPFAIRVMCKWWQLTDLTKSCVHLFTLVMGLARDNVAAHIKDSTPYSLFSCCILHLCAGRGDKQISPIFGDPWQWAFSITQHYWIQNVSVSGDYSSGTWQPGGLMVDNWTVPCSVLQQNTEMWQVLSQLDSCTFQTMTFLTKMTDYDIIKS